MLKRNMNGMDQEESRLNVIPIGRNAFEMKEVTWSSGHRMSLIGMRLASRTAEDYLIEEGKLTVRVASLKAILTQNGFLLPRF